MRISVPKKLDLESAINFCNFIDLLTDAENHEFDFSNMGRVEPFAMLMVGAKLRQCKRKFPNMHRTANNYKGPNCKYASHMVFFRSFGLEYGNIPGQAEGNGNFFTDHKNLH